MRVVSLLPSATEIVHALGLGEALVGRSHECDHPADVLRLPVVSLARIGAEQLSSAEIDARVREAVAAGEELYRIDEDVLADLRPDLVITQTLCRVCAVSGDGVRSTLRVRQVPAEVVELEPTTFEGVLESILELGRRLHAAGTAEVLVEGLRQRLRAVEAAVSGLPERPPTFVCEWLDPPFAAGHWVPEMVALAGGVEVLGVAGAPSFVTTWEAVRAREPAACLLAPCGFDVEQTMAALDAAALRAGLAGTSALRDGRVYAVDATAYFSRPGPRLVEGVELCASLLHPDDVPDRMPAGAWARVEV